LKISEQRLLSDSAVIEHLRANVRRLRVAGSWYRQCAFAKILSGSRPCNASAQTDPVHFAKRHEKGHKKSSVVDPQTGAVLPVGEVGGGSKTAGADSDSDDSKQENRYTYASMSFCDILFFNIASFPSFCFVVVFSFSMNLVYIICICSSIQVLWTSIIRSALQSVLSMRSNDSSIELQPVLDTACQLYSSKIAADLQADSSHIRRQTLPEFMYSTYLFQMGEPSAAKHALTEFITLVFYFEKV
jgi:hypothetical protein